MTGQTEPTFDLFISYAEADRAWVEGFLFDALYTANVRLLDEEMFHLGVPRLTEFERAVKQSRRTLLVLTPAYLSNNDTQFVDLLINTFGLETSTWPVIPLLLQPTTLPTRLAMLTRLDATNPATWPDVVAQLCREVGRSVPQKALLPTCPYPGMRSFGEADSEHFYGRDVEVEELVQRLRQHRFLAVIGPSGSGKSSLVFAGLLPALHKSTLFGRNSWHVFTTRPGDKPLTALAQVLGVTEVNQFSAPTNEHVLLIVDQFEELFTLHSVEDRSFTETLRNFSKSDRCYVLLTVRADFYVDLMASSLWPEIQRHRLEILPLGENGLRAAIVKPAESLGVYIETSLIERVVANATGQPGVLPFVQELLVLLWDRIERRFLPLRAYEALILPYKSITGEQRTGLQVAMARKADQIFADLSDTQQVIARRIFLRLVQFGEGRGHTRRQQPVPALRSAGEDSEMFDKTLQYLADNRLLTLNGNEQDTSKADLSHEAMIAGWPLLSKWVEERQGAEEMRRRLESKAAEWVRLGRGEGGLLDESELKEAVEWLSTANTSDLGVSSDLFNLVKVSRTAFNPGWHRLGTLALLMLTLAWIGAAGLLWIYTQDQAALLRTTLWLVATLATLSALIALLRPGDRHRLQKVTYVLARPAMMIAVLACVALVGGWWVRFAYARLQTTQRCVTLYREYPTDGVNKLGVVNTSLRKDLDPYFLVLFNNILTSYPATSAQQIAVADVEPCGKVFSHVIALEEQTLPAQQRKFIADIDGQPHLNSAVYSEDGQVNCQLFAKFARSVAVELGLQNSSLLKEANIAKVSCVAFELNEQGYDAYVQALTVDPAQYPKNYDQRQLQLLNDAQQKLEQAIKASNGQFAIPYNTLGDVYLERGYIDALGDGHTEYYRKARDEFTQAVQLLPGFASYTAELAYACQLADDWSCAETRFKEALQLEPDNAMYLLNLANFYLAKGDIQQCEHYLHQAEEILRKRVGETTQAQFELQSYLYLTQAASAFAHQAWQQAADFAQQGITAGGLEHFEEIAYYLAMSHLALDSAAPETLAKVCEDLQFYTTLPSQSIAGEFVRRQAAQTKARKFGCS